MQEPGTRGVSWTLDAHNVAGGVAWRVQHLEAELAELNGVVRVDEEIWWGWVLYPIDPMSSRSLGRGAIGRQLQLVEVLTDAASRCPGDHRIRAGGRAGGRARPIGGGSRPP